MSTAESTPAGAKAWGESIPRVLAAVTTLGLITYAATFSYAEAFCDQLGVWPETLGVSQSAFAVLSLAAESVLARSPQQRRDVRRTLTIPLHRDIN